MGFLTFLFLVCWYVTEALQVKKKLLFVSQVIHWYSQRKRKSSQRVGDVTEKVSLVHTHTQMHINTHAQLDFCFTRGDVRSSIKSIFWCLLCVAHRAGLQAHSKTNLNTRFRTPTGQQVIRTSHTLDHGTQVLLRCPSDPCWAHDCFQERLWHVHAGEGGGAVHLPA